MSLIFSSRLFQFQKLLITPLQYAVQTKNYAVPGMKATAKIGKKGAKKTTKKIELPVEKDVNKLVTHLCGSNIYKEGGEDIVLKPDSEYPDWLWKIKTEVTPLSELSPDTKQYWRRVRKLALVRNNRMRTITRK